MWKTIMGGSAERAEQSSSNPQKRNPEDESSSSRRRSDSNPSTTSKRRSTRGEDRGFNPSSTSYSSTTKSPYPGTAAASVASSYATADTRNPATGPLVSPELIRNESMASGIRNTKDNGNERRSERRRDREKSDSRERPREKKERRRSSSRDREERKRERKNGKDKSRKEEDGYSTARAFDPAAINGNTGPSNSASFVQNQFPGEFPSTFAQPYRPPGLATDYYSGVPVLEQQQIQSVAPLGPVGVESIQASQAPKPAKPSRSSKADTPSRPSRTSTYPEAAPRYGPGLPPAAMASAATAIGAAGLASEYYDQARPIENMQQQTTFTMGTPGSSGNAVPPTSTNASFPQPTPNAQFPPVQLPTTTSSVPLYGAAATAAGLAAGAYYVGHQNQSTTSFNNSLAGPGAPSTPMMHRHQHRGPMHKLVDFFKDPEAVGGFEEYTEYIGVCRYCFEPGSSPRDAPRRHRYRRQSRGSLNGSTTRVDKLNRYVSSDEERRKKSSNGKSWLAAGATGYGMAKVGQAIFKNNKDFDDTYSVKSGRPIDSRGPTYSEGVKASRVEIRDESDSRRSRRRKDSERYSEVRREDSKTAVDAALIGGAAVAAGLESRRRKSRSRSPKKKSRASFDPALSYVDLSGNTSRREDDGFNSFWSSPSANRTKSGKRKNKAFFNFNNASSSSSDADLAFGVGYVKRKSSRSDNRDRRDDNVDAAILGLGATAAALAVAGSRDSRKEKLKPKFDSRQDRKYNGMVNEDGWEDASDNDVQSVDSGLAYGITRRTSRDSIRSDDSGTGKWAWRWNNQRREKPRKTSSAADMAATAAGVAAVGSALGHGYGGDSVASSQPLQQVYPMPTTDPHFFDIARHSSVGSPVVARSSQIPLQQPQPVAPVSQALYGDSISGPPIDTSYAAYSRSPLVLSQDPLTESPTQITSAPPRNREERESGRERDTRWRMEKNGVNGSTVTFDIPEQTRRKKEVADEREERPRRKSEETEEERAARKERRRREREAEAEAEPKETEEERAARKERRRQKREAEAEAEKKEKPTREQEIDRELQELYEEEKGHAKVDGKSEKSSWVAPAVIGAAAAAAGMAAISESKESHVHDGEEDMSRKEKKERRSRKTREEEIRGEAAEAKMPERSDSLQRRLARMAAERIKSSPSPVHEDYGSFFIPSELREKLKDHNDASEYRNGTDTPSEVVPQFVTIMPLTAKLLFPEDLYSPFGVEPEHDPLRWPWIVPQLGLVEPTPKNSVAGSIRGDLSPVIEPRDDEPVAIEESEESSKGPRVSRGDEPVRDYEDRSPDDETPESVDPERRQSDSPPSDSSEASRARRRERRRKAEAQAALDQEPEVPRTSKPRRNHSPPENMSSKNEGTHGTDLEFAAVVAAGTELANFDPNIVVDDPKYHRRDSPPGSEAAVSYIPADGVPDRPMEEVAELKLSKKERRKLEKAAKRSSKGPEDTAPDTEQTESKDGGKASGRSVPGSFNVFDYYEGTSPPPEDSMRTTKSKDFSGLDDEIDKIAHSSAEVYFPKDVGEGVASKPSGDDTHFDDVVREAMNHAKDSSSRKSARRKSKRDSEIFDDNASVAASAPGYDELEGGRKSKRTSNRDGEVFDDAASTISSPVTRKEGTKSKGKKSGGMFSGLFGVVKAAQANDTALPSEESSVKEEAVAESISRNGDSNDFEEVGKQRKKKSRDRGFDDDDAVDRLNESSASGNVREIFDSVNQNGEPLKAERPEMPAVTEGVSGLENPSSPSRTFEFNDPLQAQSPLPLASSRSRSASPQLTSRIYDEIRTPHGPDSTSRTALLRQRRLSEIRTTGAGSSPATGISPTAVPLNFRRPPPSPSHSRSGSTNAADLESPQSAIPLSLPRTRKERPRSAEFRSSKDFRPLWLVERHSIAKIEPEVEENYPPLPSSRESSANPSLEDLTAYGQYEDGSAIVDHQIKWYDQDEDQRYWTRNRRRSAGEYLGSQETTPTAAEFPQSVKTQKPKYEFHSPSELLEDHTSHQEGQEYEPRPISPMQLPHSMSTESLANIAADKAVRDGEPGPQYPTDADVAELGTRDSHGNAEESGSMLPTLGLGAAAAGVAIAAMTSSSESPVDDAVPEYDTASGKTREGGFESSRDQPATQISESIEDPLSSRSSSKKLKKDKKKKRQTISFPDEVLLESASKDGVPTEAEFPATEAMLEGPFGAAHEYQQQADVDEPKSTTFTQSRTSVDPDIFEQATDVYHGTQQREDNDTAVPLVHEERLPTESLRESMSESMDSSEPVADLKDPVEDEWALPSRKLSKKEKRKKSKSKSGAFDEGEVKIQEPSRAQEESSAARELHISGEQEIVEVTQGTTFRNLPEGVVDTREVAAKAEAPFAFSPGDSFSHPSVLEDAFESAKAARGLHDDPTNNDLQQEPELPASVDVSQVPETVPRDETFAAAEGRDTDRTLAPNSEGATAEDLWDSPSTIPLEKTDVSMPIATPLETPGDFYTPDEQLDEYFWAPTSKKGKKTKEKALSSASASGVTSPILESIQETPLETGREGPEEYPWTPTPKRSKKDKNKNKSVATEAIEEPITPALKSVPVTSLETVKEEADDSEWASTTTKKGKKDKKKKSKAFTFGNDDAAAESMVDLVTEPSATEPSVPEKVMPETPLATAQEEVGDFEWAQTTKKTKKDKKKKGKSSAAEEDAAEPALASEAPLVSDTPMQTAQEEVEALDWASTTKDSQVDREKALGEELMVREPEVSRDVVEDMPDEPYLDTSTTRALPKAEIPIHSIVKDHEPFISPHVESFEKTQEIQGSREEPDDFTWAAPLEKGKKSEKSKRDSIPLLDENSQEVSQAELAAPVEAQEPSIEGSEWTVPSKKSKKDKKKRKSSAFVPEDEGEGVVPEERENVPAENQSDSTGAAQLMPDDHATKPRGDDPSPFTSTYIAEPREIGLERHTWSTEAGDTFSGDEKATSHTQVPIFESPVEQARLDPEMSARFQEPDLVVEPAHRETATIADTMASRAIDERDFEPTAEVAQKTIPPKPEDDLDQWSIQAKKSKKDKKNKRRSEVEMPESSGVTNSPVLDTAVGAAVGAAGAAGIATAIGTSESPREHPDEFSLATPGKKSKKDKKKKKQTFLDWEDEPAKEEPEVAAKASQLQDPPRHYSDARELIDERDDYPAAFMTQDPPQDYSNTRELVDEPEGKAASSFADTMPGGFPDTEATAEDGSATEPIKEDEWALPSESKSRRDQKKKKQAFLDWEDEPVQDASTAEDQPALSARGEITGHDNEMPRDFADEPRDNTQATIEEPLKGVSIVNDAIPTGETQAAEESEWAVPSRSKSKKDKKKKKKQIAFDWGDEGTREVLDRAEPSVEVMHEPPMEVIHQPPMEASHEQDTMKEATLTEPEDARTAFNNELVKGAAPVEEATSQAQIDDEDEWALASKPRSKKDKKKKQLLADYETAGPESLERTDIPTNISGDVGAEVAAQDAMVASSHLPETTADRSIEEDEVVAESKPEELPTNVEEEWAVPVRSQSKKDRKGKKIAFDLSDEQPTLPPEDIEKVKNDIDAEVLTQDVMDESSQLPYSSKVDPLVPEVTQYEGTKQMGNVEDEWAVTPKKSKKDKKKKRQSTINYLEEPATTTVPETEPMAVDTAKSSRSIVEDEPVQDNSTRDFVAVDPNNSREDDPWGTYQTASAEPRALSPRRVAAILSGHSPSNGVSGWITSEQDASDTILARDEPEKESVWGFTPPGKASKSRNSKKVQSLAAWEENDTPAALTETRKMEKSAETSNWETMGFAAATATAVTAAGAYAVDHRRERTRERSESPDRRIKRSEAEEYADIAQGAQHTSIFGPFDGKTETGTSRALSPTYMGPEPAWHNEVERPRNSDIYPPSSYHYDTTDNNRDSAIHMSDSPLISQESIHDAVRDSSYGPSPIAPIGFDSPRDMHSVVSRPPRPVSPTSSADHQQRRGVSESHPGLFDFPPPTRGKTRPISPTSSTEPPKRRSVSESQPSLFDFPSSTTARSPRHREVSPLHVDVEVDPTYDVSLSRDQGTARRDHESRQATVSHSGHGAAASSSTPEQMHRHPSPIDSTTKQRSSDLFGSSPSNREAAYATSHEEPRSLRRPPSGLRRSPSIHHGNHRSDEESLAQQYREHSSQQPTQSQPSPLQGTVHEIHGPAFGTSRASLGAAISPPRTPLGTIDEYSDLRDQPRGVSSRDEDASAKAKSQPSSATRTRHRPESLDASSLSNIEPRHDKALSRTRDMAGVYNGWGEAPGSPNTPDRPQSVRRRQSMQRLQDLEARLDQLAAENRLLATQKITAEKHLEDFHFSQSKSDSASQEALQTREVQLREKDADIERLRESLSHLQEDLVRLTQVNEGLTSSNLSLASQHERSVNELQAGHGQTHQQWEESTRELETLREQHNQLSSGMEEIVRHEIDIALAEKNEQIERLENELEMAKAKIRELQYQVMASRSDETLDPKDEDYFEQACQDLCQRVKQWVLRFSKFSDTRVCRTIGEIRDEKIVDRFDNAVLDGSEVDSYLTDRVKRRDVFMSVVMTMIFEYIFSRYLFGMDREQRQKLKQLEKNLSEIGPASAVNRWRALTLTLLTKRPSFQSQCSSDTEAVVLEVYNTLTKFLPPSHHLESQILDSLRNVMKAAVDLSIEMRTQRAEYIMLPPLQPEYDTNGDLERKVYFNAALMNERSGETTSNEELEQAQAVVRMVLFPLVVKKGSDDGEGDDEIVVCPAQVLVARPEAGRDRKARVVSGGTNQSVHSFAPSSMDMGGMI